MAASSGTSSRWINQPTGAFQKRGIAKTAHSLLPLASAMAVPSAFPASSAPATDADWLDLAHSSSSSRSVLQPATSRAAKSMPSSRRRALTSMMTFSDSRLDRESSASAAPRPAQRSTMQATGELAGAEDGGRVPFGLAAPALPARRDRAKRTSYSAKSTQSTPGRQPDGSRGLRACASGAATLAGTAALTTAGASETAEGTRRCKDVGDVAVPAGLPSGGVPLSLTFFSSALAEFQLSVQMLQ
mmetsp:Transcript_59791/g.187699  ORF Transcript_59791/g.187699 Transcript_59791/m.187699 type:complete len:244 (+) Transcript_59791:1554-2285(+)